MIYKFMCYRTTKNRLWQKVRPMSREEFISLINPIISSKRNIDLEMAKRVHFLNSNEVIAFLEKIGLGTADFGKTIVLDAGHTTKQVLRVRIPFLSTSEFNDLLHHIVTERRKMDIGRAKYRRYLMASEVSDFLREIGEKVVVS